MRAGRSLLLVGLMMAGLAALPSPAVAAPRIHWLCKPGLAHNPCSVGLGTTKFSPRLKKLGVEHVRPARHPEFDCFYVYPTVSDQKTAVANFHVDPELRSIALYQAARYTSECRMFVPVYRQVTLASLLGMASPTAAEREQAYDDVRDAWRTYLRKFNRGRGVVLISHSQGTFVLRRLVGEEIDRKPKVRRRLISAVLLGGNVVVKRGKDVGGDFKHIRACRSTRQVGCVVAFSTFNAPVPEQAVFGRTADPALEVLCTNPAALSGGSAKITPIYPIEPFAPGTTIGGATGGVSQPSPKVRTPWVAFPGSYRAQCSSAGGAHVLEIAGVGGAPELHAVPDAGWGLHLTDANIALGDLVDLVRSQAASWRRQGR